MVKILSESVLLLTRIKQHEKQMPQVQGNLVKLHSHSPYRLTVKEWQNLPPSSTYKLLSVWKVDLFTNNWPVCTKAGHCAFLLPDSYSLRLLIHWDLLLTFANLPPLYCAQQICFCSELLHRWCSFIRLCMTNRPHLSVLHLFAFSSFPYHT